MSTALTQKPPGILPTMAPVIRAKGPVYLVWTIWALMLGAALLCIGLYGRNVPLAEDWLLVAPLTGNEPDLVQWLWAQNNEHRVPLPRLILLSLLTASGGDFRVGMYFNALLLGALAAAMILTARSLRNGQVRYSDAFFPVALLHIGHWENLVWGWQLQFVAATGITCALLLVVVNTNQTSRPRTALLAGILLVLLPLNGANGLIFGLAMAPWVACEGMLQLLSSKKREASRRVGTLLIGSVVATLLLSGAYFIGYERATWNPPSPGPWATIKTGAKYLALGLGPAAAWSWILSVSAVLVAVGSSAVLLAISLRGSRGTSRRRAVGFSLFLVGAVVLAIAVGWGRSGLVPTAGLPMRYALLAVPALCAAYFIWEIDGKGLGRRLQMGLCIAACILLVPNAYLGFTWRDWYTGGMHAFESELRAGTPCAVLVEHHYDFLLHWDRVKLASSMGMLKRAAIGPFRHLQGEHTCNAE